MYETGERGSCRASFSRKQAGPNCHVRRLASVSGKASRFSVHILCGAFGFVSTVRLGVAAKSRSAGASFSRFAQLFTLVGWNGRTRLLPSESFQQVGPNCHLRLASVSGKASRFSVHILCGAFGFVSTVRLSVAAKSRSAGASFSRFAQLFTLVGWNGRTRLLPSESFQQVGPNCHLRLASVSWKASRFSVHILCGAFGFVSTVRLSVAAKSRSAGASFSRFA